MKRARFYRIGSSRRLTLGDVEHSSSTTHPPRPRPAAVAGGVPRPAGPPAAGPRERGRPRGRPRPGAARRAPALDALARLPRPRLTGLGCGVLATAVMMAAGWLSRLFGGAPAFYGIVFLLAATAAAAWVRPADLVCAPVAVPIAYAAGLVVTHGLLSLVTELALGAGWLFAGTALATVVVLVRRAAQAVAQVAARRTAGRRRP